MIVYPENWERIGTPIPTADIEARLIEVLREIYCNCLSFSGGVDSSLLLYYLCQIFQRIEIFTMGASEAHPDIMFAKDVVEQYKRRFFHVSFEHHIRYPTEGEIKDTGGKEGFLGDKTVQSFYKFVAEQTDKIIAGDVIDEYTCGYYAHMANPTEEVYYNHIRRLQKNHLVPLNANSDKVKVWLPYADEEIIAMLSQIPIKDKVDCVTRKKIIMEMAKGKVPDDVILRRKYGFCDALIIKGAKK